MKRIPTILLLAVGIQTGSSQGFAVKVTVVNPSSISRTSELVAVPWKDLPSSVSRATVRDLRLLDDRGWSTAFQIDDSDGDGQPDELAFIVDVAAGERKFFLLTDTAAALASPAGPLRTDAGNWKRIKNERVAVDDDDGPGLLRSQSSYVFDGVGWESELIGYRLYLDERNALDIQAKRNPGLHWNYIGSTGVDYQLDAHWGMDVLHVGPAVGVGGFGFWMSDSLVKPFPLERRRTRILARGPVRSLVMVEYHGWKVGKENVDVRVVLSIHAGSRVSHQRVTLTRGGPETLAIGIVKHQQGAVVWNKEAAYLYTLGRQSRANDSLLLALVLPAGLGIKKTEDANNHLVLLDLVPGQARTFKVAALWEGEDEEMWTRNRIEEFLSGESLRLSEPLQIQID